MTALAAEFVLEMRGCTIAPADAGARGRVRAVEWRVAAGSCWAVGGPAGCGKTRLLETAAGLRAPESGQVWLFGRDVARLSDLEGRALRRQVALVYSGGGRLVGHLTLAQNLALPLCYHRNCPPAAVADELAQLLAAFGLEPVAHRLPGQVNPACRQRAALARALALRPALLLLDNPFEWLNTAQVRWWLEFLRGAHPVWPRPSTVVVATDDLRPWRGVAEHVALIRDGRWQPLADGAALEADNPVLRDLLAADAPPA